MSILLVKQILELFLSILAGWLVVRLGLLKASDSKALSVVALYVVIPCMIFHSFQIGYSDAVRDGLVLGVVLALLLHLLFYLAVKLLGRALGLDAVEQTSVMYSNAGNLIVPIVTALFGSEYIIYTSSYMAVQLVLLWTHARVSLSGGGRIDLRKIFCNINMAAIALGLLFFLLQLPLPQVIEEATGSIGSMIGPLCMIVAGMLMADVDWSRLPQYRRLPLVAVLRLVVLPAAVVLLLLLVRRFVARPELDSIYVISLLAAVTPTAATITQLCQISGRDSRYANMIYLLTTLLCVVTMPLVLGCYFALAG